MAQYDQDRDSARADLCRLLAACYYQPGPEFGEERIFDSMCAAAVRILPEFATRARRLGEAFAAEGHENLLLDYTRLFLGPVEAIAKPYGSVWLEGERSLMQGSTAALVELYREGGFEIDENFRELPDHVAAELEFLYVLIFRESAAQRGGQAAALREIAQLRKRFLEGHLGRWAGPFTAAVAAGAQSAFYRELAGLTARFVATENASQRAKA